ncbi:TPA: hypothetical protein ACTW83_005503, partial [Klebsiella michiganensis]
MRLSGLPDAATPVAWTVVARVRRLRRDPVSVPGLMYPLSFFPARAALSRATYSPSSAGPVARVRRLRRDPGSVPGVMYQLSFFPARAALSRATYSPPSAV